jgi:hypothetical protein
MNLPFMKVLLLGETMPCSLLANLLAKSLVIFVNFSCGWLYGIYVGHQIDWKGEVWTTWSLVYYVIKRKKPSIIYCVCASLQDSFGIPFFRPWYLVISLCLEMRSPLPIGGERYVRGYIEARERV